MSNVCLQKRATAFLKMVAGLTLAVLSGGIAASAQGIITGSITGDVVDQTGASIPGASVTATSESTGATLKALANGQGNFIISDVPLGSYAVIVSATGFGPSRFNHVVVVAGAATSVGKVAMNLGSTAQTVQVEADTGALINSESAQVETTIDAVQLESAPVTGALDNIDRKSVV